MRQLFILGIALLLAACQEPAPITTLNATVPGAEEDAQLVVTGPDYRKELDLTEGSVQDTLMISQPGLYSFNLGWQALKTYLTPGETVTISGDAEEFAAKGTFTDDKQQAIAAYFQGKQSVTQEYLSMRSLLGMEPDSFQTALELAETKLKEHLDGTVLPPSVAANEQEGFAYKTAELRYLYPLYTDREKADLPSALQDPLAGMNMTDEAKFKENEAYASLVDTKFSIDMNSDTSKDYIGTFMRMVKEFPEGGIRNALLYNNMRYMIGPNDKLEGHMAFFKELSTDKVHLAKMEEQYDAYQDLMRGKPSPDFDYENYLGGNTKLKDLRGKYVYVDVWATWCGPCIGEIPSLKEKEEKYHDANIEFVSLSIDDPEDEEKWRKMIENRELGGTQLIADNAWESDFPKAYQVNGIPRFILIDPEGNIVSADAPRPSSDELDELFGAEGIK